MPKKTNLLLTVGQPAVADFMPQRIKDLHDGRKNRHNLAIATLIVTAVCASIFATTSAWLSVADASLRAERSSTEKILVAQSTYSDIISLLNESRILGLSYFVASEPEVNWSAVVRQLIKPMPSGVSLTSVDLTGVNAGAAAAASPLSGQAITVTVDIYLEGDTFQGVEFFLLDARQWPGYMNAEIADMHKTAGGYVATVDIHLGMDALIEDAKHKAILQDGIH
ncbi:MAG: hypothetical protein RIQ31_396 [Actinomycetota bacterium]